MLAFLLVGQRQSLEGFPALRERGVCSTLFALRATALNLFCTRAQVRSCHLLRRPLPCPSDWILQALTTAFDLLETSRALGDTASSGCSTAILLLTDGEITEGLGFDDPSEIATLVQTLNVDIEAQIFTFALGPEADSVSGRDLTPRVLAGGLNNRPPLEQTGRGHRFSAKSALSSTLLSARPSLY